MEGEARSKHLVSIFPDVPKSAPILELGCNCGRNLWWLQQAGFTNLTGMDINQEAMESKAFPLLKWNTKCVDMELKFDLEPYEVIFTMAVLEHLYNEFAIDAMARSAKWILTIEDEKNISETHQARNYKDMFESRGFAQVEQYVIPWDGAFVGRLFTR